MLPLKLLLGFLLGLRDCVVQIVEYFILDWVPIHELLACQAPSLKAPTRRIPAVGNGGGIE